MSQSTRVAIVTGASRGLGDVIARVLAVHGHDLVIGGRDERALAAAADDLRTIGGRIATVPGDVADPAVQAAFIDEARAMGGLQVLVNNASELGGMRPVADVRTEDLDRLFLVNVGAPVALIRRATPLLKKSGGLVVNISSDAARGGYPGWGAYGATKAALDLLTLTLDAELRADGIHAVSVDPGDMRTRMHQEAFAGQDISDRPLPEITIPFWNWLFHQDAASIGGERFAAQQEDERWLQRV